jgi:hypothetical protein
LPRITPLASGWDTTSLLVLHHFLDVGADVRLFPLPACVRQSAEYGAGHSVACSQPRTMALPLQWWLRLGLASSRTPLQNHDTHANLSIRADASECRAEVGPCRCLPGRLAPMRHRHHQQPLAGPGRGTEVPGVGADSRRPIRRVRRAARRPESRSPAPTRPRRRHSAERPLYMRCLDPLF